MHPEHSAVKAHGLAALTDLSGTHTTLHTANQKSAPGEQYRGHTQPQDAKKPSVKYCSPLFNLARLIWCSLA